MPRAKRAKRAPEPPTGRSGRVAETPASAYAAQRLLLDTHVWLWWQSGSRRLGYRARAAIASSADVCLSAVSAWEIAIKSSIGKLTPPLNANIREQLDRDGFRELPMTIAHAEAVRGLPAGHHDPFDRLLIAQAHVEGLTIVTADALFKRYGVAILDATS
jgi:PIN domain nuclease of toxin-antitoxin system